MAENHDLGSERAEAHRVRMSKVMAYITRPSAAGGLELLAFTQFGRPGSGLQVPGGTVEPGEPILDALRREILEESGLSGEAAIEALGVFEYLAQDRPEVHIRHVFHVRYAEAMPDRWSHVVRSAGEDDGLRFDYTWLPAERAGELVAGNQGAYWRTGP